MDGFKNIICDGEVAFFEERMNAELYNAMREERQIVVFGGRGVAWSIQWEKSRSFN
jgi:hypothetical protein